MCRNMDILLKFNFAEKYSRSENPSKNQKKNHPKSRNEVATESRSRDKKLFVQLIPGYDISRTSLEEEIKGLFKRRRDLKFKW